MKKIISAILAIVLIISLAAPASAADYYFPKFTGISNSFADAMKEVAGAEFASYEARSKIAEANGVTDYVGSAAQNEYMFDLLRAGRLKTPGAQVGGAGSGRFYARYGGSSNSIIEALNSLCIDSSYAHRALIAKVNGYGSSYSGKANENIDLLNKLKAGVLVNPHAAASQNAQSSGAAMQAVGGASTRNVTYVEVTSSTAPLRSGPGKSYEKVVDLQMGDCLVYTGFTENKYGNVWYVCEYAGNDEKVYLFSDHAVFHEHSYQKVSDEIHLCTCGEYTVDSDSEMVKTGMVDTAGTLLSPEVVAAVVELAWAAKSFGSGAVAALANPVTAVVVVGGALIYMGVSSSGTQVKYLAKIASASDVANVLRWEEDYNECYYASCFVTGATPMLLLTSEGMNLNEATDYLEDIVYSPLNAFKTINGQSLLNIWTFTAFDAEELCINFVSRGNNYAYGTSKQMNCDFEHDKTLYPHKIYFQHYHVHSGKNFFTMNKVKDIHILFGAPIKNNNKT